MLGAAVMLLRRHGDQAALKVAQHIGELAAYGDATGIAAWKAIARHLDAILNSRPLQ
ncbi:DUF6961 family protein [Sphingobium yanoikuyae]|nr:hypothetical protein [Sphingobium yanoikuyae]